MILRSSLPHRRILSATLTGILLTVGSTATAQTYHHPILDENQRKLNTKDRLGEDQPGVMMREYTEFTPQGMRLGSFILLPSLTTDIGYSDNIYARPNGTKDSVIGVVTPDVVLRSSWSRHAVEASAQGEIKRYASEESENVENYRFTLGGSLNITQNSTLSTLLRHQRAHEMRGDPDSETQVIEPTPLDISAGEVAFQQRFGDLTVRLEGNGKAYDFLSATRTDGQKIDASSRNYATLGGLGRVSYDLNPDFAVFGEGGWQSRTYDRAEGNGLTSRNSTGPEVAGGFSFAIGGLWSGELALGYAQREIEDAGFGSVSALTARANLLWNVTRATSLRAQAARGLGETTIGPSVVYVDTTYWFGIEHQLQSDVLLGANISTRTLDYARSQDETDILSVGARATWFINRNFRAQVEYNFSHREGSTPNVAFDRNIGMLRFVSSF